MMSMSVLVQMSDVTKTQLGLKLRPTGFNAVCCILFRSGWHLDNKSGRGFPNNNFMPWVIMKAVARDRARPIHAVFHSQAFLRQMSAFGVPRLAVGPGTKIRHTTKVMKAGAMSAMRTRSHVGMVSLNSCG